ncbi:hypothetical protein Ddc_21493 [Ditylenchus destructor]|nr:hypothetical protein Ddc_21493 [Ditylenchus destructor]
MGAMVSTHEKQGSLFAQHDNRDSQFSCGDAANILYTLHVFHCSFFAQHDNRDSQFSCGDAANILNTMRNFHYFDFQNISYQLRFKRLRAYFSKSSNMLHVSKCK